MNHMSLQAQVASFVEEKGLFNGVSRLGLAVSGGSDSISLLHLVAPLCREAGIVPVVLNFDHAIPDEHSDVDAAFVRDEAARLEIEFYGEVADGILAGGGKSLEMAAREARQAFYRRAADRFALDAIATGHQADDVAETLLLRLLRGAGAAGLAGLKPRSVLPPMAPHGLKPLVIIRPMLEIRREELRAWLNERGIGWCEDPSNANEAIQRNEVRHSILPALARRGNGLADTVNQLARSADILREEDDYLDGVAAAWLASAGGPGIVRTASGNGDLPLARLVAEQPLAIRRRVVRMWLMTQCGGVAPAPLGGAAPGRAVRQDAAPPVDGLKPVFHGKEAFGFACVEALLGLADGDVATLSGGWRAKRMAGMVGIVPDEVKDSVPPETLLAMPGELHWGRYTVSVSFGGPVERSRQRLGAWPTTCTLSAQLLADKTLAVRGRKPGDRMAPYGLEGSRKLQDIFTDAKVPEAKRDSYPVIVCGDEIVWLPGYRIAAPYAVRDGDECLRLTVGRFDSLTL